jgi:hypothetical protein
MAKVTRASSKQSRGNPVLRLPDLKQSKMQGHGPEDDVAGTAHLSGLSARAGMLGPLVIAGTSDGSRREENYRHSCPLLWP